MKDNDEDIWSTSSGRMTENQALTLRSPNSSIIHGSCQIRSIDFRQTGFSLLFLGACTFAMPASHDAAAAGPRSGDLAQPTVTQCNKPADDDKELNEFLAIYRLVPGQDLKLVEAPRPTGFDIWWRRKHPNPGNRISNYGAMTLSWTDPERLERWSVSSAGGIAVRRIPYLLKVDVVPREIEGDSTILDAVVTGDWVFREGVRDERTIAALSSILQRVVRHRIKMEFRNVDREVVVVRGEYRHTPLPGRKQNEIDIYGNQLFADSRAGGGTGTFSQFLRRVGTWIEHPVISEVAAPPKERVSWYLHVRSVFTKEMQKEDHDEALVLKHLHEQTGLTFTREKKPVRILFVERAR